VRCPPIAIDTALRVLVAVVGLSASANSQVAQPISAPPSHYNVLSIAPGGWSAGINNFGQVLLRFGDEDMGFTVSLWTPTVANSGSSGNLVSVTDPRMYMVPGGINDCGQVTYGPYFLLGGGPPYIWSPDTPNGSAGTALLFLDDIDTAPFFWVYPQTLRINAFGQISGQIYFIYFIDPQYPTQFLWTPFQANGSSGASNTDPRLMGIVAINDFGQAIMGGGVRYGSEVTSLFTPSVANGASGTFTSIPGLPGITTAFLADINETGTIVGWGCPSGLSGNQCQTFVWVPTSRNSPSGTTAGIPIPTGFSAMVPAAINSLGDIVGVLTGVGGGNFPFLYTCGAVYDLSALSNQLVGATPAGINDAGQIAVNTASGAYLLTPEGRPIRLPIGARIGITNGCRRDHPRYPFLGSCSREAISCEVGLQEK
jgi:hypothetical protein